LADDSKKWQKIEEMKKAKEELELLECTFKPEVNDNKSMPLY
jgi:hypothetical protein